MKSLEDITLLHGNITSSKTNDSFIFSFKNENNFFRDAIISNVENTNYAIRYYPNTGPYFGKDIRIGPMKKNCTIFI